MKEWYNQLLDFGKKLYQSDFFKTEKLAGFSVHCDFDGSIKNISFIKTQKFRDGTDNFVLELPSYTPHFYFEPEKKEEYLTILVEGRPSFSYFLGREREPSVSIKFGKYIQNNQLQQCLKDLGCYVLRVSGNLPLSEIDSLQLFSDLRSLSFIFDYKRPAYSKLELNYEKDKENESLKFTTEIAHINKLSRLLNLLPAKVNVLECRSHPVVEWVFGNKEEKRSEKIYKNIPSSVRDVKRSYGGPHGFDVIWEFDVIWNEKTEEFLRNNFEEGQFVSVKINLPTSPKPLLFKPIIDMIGGSKRRHLYVEGLISPLSLPKKFIPTTIQLPPEGVEDYVYLSVGDGSFLSLAGLFMGYPTKKRDYVEGVLNFNLTGLISEKYDADTIYNRIHPEILRDLKINFLPSVKEIKRSVFDNKDKKE